MSIWRFGRALLALLRGPSQEEKRDAAPRPAARRPPGGEPGALAGQSLAELEIASAPGNERVAVEQVVAAVRGVGLAEPRLEQLKTAVAEATMNAMEHGNQYRSELPVLISVRRRGPVLSVSICDWGAGLTGDPAAPDLEAKLAGLQTPRGWGRYLIRHMVDELREEERDGKHVVELLFHLEAA